MERTVRFAELAIDDDNILRRVENVLRSGQFILGHENKEFARRWAAICGALYCVPTSSGSAALTATVRAMHTLGNLDGMMLLPALSFAATAFSVREARIKLAYCDVNEHGLIDQVLAAEMAHSLGDALFGIMPVWLYGQCEDVCLDFIDDRNICVIEDAAQAHGALNMVQGDAACFSFYPTKNLGAAGDAGAVVTNNLALADHIYAYVNYGDARGRKYAHSFQSTNMRMDEVQAAILNAKLDGDSTILMQNQIRRDIAWKYDAAGIASFVNHTRNAYHQYPILVDAEHRDAFRSALQERGIDTGNHYPYTLRKVALGYSHDTPVADRIASQVVTLPIGIHLKEDDVSYVSDVIREVAELTVDVKGNLVWELKRA